MGIILDQVVAQLIMQVRKALHCYRDYIKLLKTDMTTFYVDKNANFKFLNICFLFVFYFFLFF